MRQHSQTGRADLVGDVAVAGDAVAAEEHGLHPALPHDEVGHVVADERAVHARARQLIARQARALQKRARLVDPDVQPDAALLRQIERPLRRAVARGGQRPCVAVRQDVVPVVQQRQAVFRNRAAHVHVLLMDRGRLAVERGQQRRARRVPVRQHDAVHAPKHVRKVHRCRAGAVEIVRKTAIFAVKAVEIGRVDPGGQHGHGIGRKNADGGRAADAQRVDRLPKLARLGKCEVLRAVRQERLIQNDDRPALAADVDGVGHGLDAHRSSSSL